MPKSMRPRVLALDAMGVIYKNGDDVKDLLIPFISKSGGTEDTALIENQYHAASLGKISAEKFWQSVGLKDVNEDDYLATLSLTPGLKEFLPWAEDTFEQILCLSNDLAKWSKKLRRKFELEKHIPTWVIGGDVNLRKPAKEIYEIMIKQTGAEPHEIIFVDDRAENLHAAADLGLKTIMFNAETNEQTNDSLAFAGSFPELQKTIQNMIES